MKTPILEQISADLALPRFYLEKLIHECPYRYKVYEIAKRSGEGKRIIAQPAKEVKMLQYWVLANYLSRFNIHPSATAYRTGKSIKDNARPHAIKPYMLKLDFKDFFPSIKGTDFELFLKDYGELQQHPEDVNAIIRILFRKPKNTHDLQLSIGAPSSPCLSNVLMYKLDCRIYEYCSANNIHYTRYADDLTFSMETTNLRKKLIDYVILNLKHAEYPTLKINPKKTIYSSKANKRFVTGVVLTNDGKISLGRDRKRRIRAQLHHLSQGKLSSEKERNSLRGMLAFARDIEPSFVSRMEEKYGLHVFALL